MTSEPGPALSRAELRDLYDRFGLRQDQQGWYEDKALAVLLRHGGFALAEVVVEPGCGTGRFAGFLLEKHLNPEARYIGLEISRTMVGLARERLLPWGERVEIHLTDGGFDFPPCDVLVATYVLDLMSEEDIGAFLAGAHRALRPGGRLCLAGLSAEHGPVNRLWSLLYRLMPQRLGGCRPTALASRLERRHWRLLHREDVSSYGLASEAVIATPVT